MDGRRRGRGNERLVDTEEREEIDENMEDEITEEMRSNNECCEV